MKKHKISDKYSLVMNNATYMRDMGNVLIKRLIKGEERGLKTLLNLDKTNTDESYEIMEHIIRFLYSTITYSKEVFNMTNKLNLQDSDNAVVTDQDGHTRDKFGNPIPPLSVPDDDKDSVDDDGEVK